MQSNNKPTFSINYKLDYLYKKHKALTEDSEAQLQNAIYKHRSEGRIEHLRKKRDRYYFLEHNIKEHLDYKAYMGIDC